MDKLINKHVDRVEVLTTQMDRVILEEVSAIDIDAILANPEVELSRVANNIRDVFVNEYVDKAVELGFNLGRQVKQRIEDDKIIKVDDSNNPNLNA